MINIPYPDLKSVPTIAHRIKWAREFRGVTQNELADLIGTTQTNISDIERGKNQNPTKIIEIALALQVSPLWVRLGKLDGVTDYAINLAHEIEELSAPQRLAIEAMIAALKK